MAQGNQENNKRIAKNTLLLYIRMAVIMAVSLYTSRIVLDVLGIEDFGIYNVVGGVVSMLGFLNGALSTATSRFVTITIGKGDKKAMSHLFCVCVNAHLLMALLIVLLAESVGLWYLYEHVVLPPERFTAAFWVYQCSVLAVAFSILAVPYNATIIAHEKMKAFAYVSMLEAFFKLGIVYLLMVAGCDKLILYAVFILLAQLIVNACYTIYCYRHFQETNYHPVWDGQLTREMLAFASWALLGYGASICNTQGLNLLLNAFFGPAVNSARAVAVQVQNALQQFTTGFQTAINPQILKSYAQGNRDYMCSLIFRSARFSFFLLLMLALPIMIEAKWVLSLWLIEVPEHTVDFLRLILCVGMVFALVNPLMILAQATGRLKKFQIVSGCVLLCVLPVSYVFLHLGAAAWTVFAVHLAIEIIDIFVRLFLLREMVGLSVGEYAKEVLLRVVPIGIVAALVPLGAYAVLPDTFWGFVVVCAISLLWSATTIFLFGLTAEERLFVLKKLLHCIRL